MNYRDNPEFAPMPQLETIEQAGIAYLSAQAKAAPYVHYPSYPKRLKLEHVDYHTSPLDIPEGDWWVNPSDNHSLSPTETATLRAKGVSHFDSAGRPLHPWLSTLTECPDYRFVCGKGSYWEWGPNFTADPIILRHDLDEPYVLLIQRSDTLAWALPGGFVDPEEDPRVTALRETQEEAGIDVSAHLDRAQITYRGPVADPRTTLHAWPETTAVRLDIPNELAATLPQGAWQGSDDAQIAAWLPLSRVDAHLFGSHRALIQLATGF